MGGLGSGLAMHQLWKTDEIRLPDRATVGTLEATEIWDEGGVGGVMREKPTEIVRTEERWGKAAEFAREMLKNYKSLPGGTGAFGSMIIGCHLRRYEEGERSEDLLEALESIE